MLKYHSYERIMFTELEEMLYEVISRQEMGGQRSVTFSEHEQDQIDKLEESISRIKHQVHEFEQSETPSELSKCQPYLQPCLAMLRDE
jgi:hypothetical protein